MSDADLSAIAAETGADGVMCLWARPALASGYGERLAPVRLPSVPVVLVNPGVECPTRAVYQGFDRLGRFSALDAVPQDIVNIEQLTAMLGQTRNDLQAAAIALQPVIVEVLSELEAQPETLFARMSGSGATCFALCRDDAEAGALSRRMQRVRPGAWTAAGRLG